MKKEKNKSTLIPFLLLMGLLIFHLTDYFFPTLPQGVSIDSKKEIPQPVELDANENQNKEKSVPKKTRPMRKNKYLKAYSQNTEPLHFGKEDYTQGLKLETKPKEVSIYSEQPSSIEKVLSDSSRMIKQPNFTGLSHINEYKIPTPHTERYAFKIKLPEENRNTQFTIQLRQPPDFGKSDYPVPNIPQSTTANQPAFTIEKSITSESPWNNFGD